jgi:hypothetical protein
MGRKARLKRERRLDRTARAAPESARELLRILDSAGVATVEGPATGEIKISQSLLQIAQPVIDQLAPSECTIGRLDALLQVALLAWNVDSVPDGSDYVNEAVRLLADLGMPRDLIEDVLSRMIECRRHLFAGDRRFVTHVVVRPGQEPGKFDVSAAFGLPRARSTG